MSVSVRPDNALAPLLRRALASRLNELRVSLEAEPAEAAALDPEAALRRGMVILRPKLQRCAVSPDQADELVRTANVIAQHATWDDLRYIDALNAIHESWPAGVHA